MFGLRRLRPRTAEPARDCGALGVQSRRCERRGTTHSMRSTWCPTCSAKPSPHPRRAKGMADLRLLVFGSRGWSNYDLLRDEMTVEAEREWPSGDIVIVHGAARGADALADRAAKEFGWKVESHPADWSLNGKSAGPI